MTLLTLLLCFKIIVTLIFVTGPFLLLPQNRLEAMTQSIMQTPAFFRLYGVASLALLFGYGTGLWMGLQGTYPTGIIAMGLVSNGGAATILARAGRRQRTFAILFGAITLGLIATALFPVQAVTPLF